MISAKHHPRTADDDDTRHPPNNTGLKLFFHARTHFIFCESNSGAVKAAIIFQFIKMRMGKTGVQYKKYLLFYATVKVVVIILRLSSKNLPDHFYVLCISSC